MLNINNILKILKLNLRHIREKYFIKDIGIFGSYLRGDNTITSDIDILVDFENGHHDLFNCVRLRYYLESILGIKVDIVLKDSIKPPIKQNIINEVKYV